MCAVGLFLSITSEDLMYLSLETSTQLGTHFQSSHFSSLLLTLMGFLGSSDSKESACNAGDPGLILGSGRSPGEGSGYPHQYSCLGNPMDRGAWQATVHRVPKSRTRLSVHTPNPDSNCLPYRSRTWQKSFKGG